LENSFDSRYKIGGPFKAEYDKIRYKIVKKETLPETNGIGSPLTKRFNPS